MRHIVPSKLGRDCVYYAVVFSNAVCLPFDKLRMPGSMELLILNVFCFSLRERKTKYKRR